MLIRSKSIVLHTLRYSDDALIAHVLTESEGCVGFMVRIARSPRAAVRHTLFQPLAMLEIEWNHRPTAELLRPKSAVPFHTFAELPYEPAKLTTGLFLAEFLHHALRGEPPSTLLFSYVQRSLEWLDACPRGYANFHLVFLLRLTHFLGFRPNTEDYRTGFYFDLQASAFVGTRPLHPDFLSPAETALLPTLLRMRYENMRLFRFSGAERSRLLAVLIRYYRLHVPGFPELKSLDVLRAVFE